MSRVTNGPASRKRRKKVLKLAKGYYGARSRLFRTAVEVVRKAWFNAFDGRKKKKGNFRSLWISRIDIAANERGLSYSRFINALSKASIFLNRKMLSEIAIHDPKGFDKIVENVK